MKRKQNLNVSCVGNFIKMGTAARNVNDKHIDPVKFGRHVILLLGKNATLLSLFAWVVNGSGGGRNEEIA